MGCYLNIFVGEERNKKEKEKIYIYLLCLLREGRLGI